MFSYQASTLEYLGLGTLEIGEAVVYMHTAERAMCECEKLNIAQSDSRTPPEWAEALVGERMPWAAEERKILDRVVELLPSFIAEDIGNDVYRATIDGMFEVAPFAYPLACTYPGRPRSVHEGLYSVQRGKILLLRSKLLEDPLGMLSVLYREALRPTRFLDYLQRVIEQRRLCERMQTWITRQQFSRGLGDQDRMLNERIGELSRFIRSFK